MAIARGTIFAATSASTVSLASVPAGRLMLAFAYRDGNNAAPALPAGWTNIDGTGANTNSARVAFKISDGAEGSPAFTNATTLIVLTYQATVGAIGVGGFAVASGASTSVSYPAVTMADDGGTSWLAAFSGHRSVNTALETPPTGFTLLSNPLDATDEAAAFDTGAGVSGFSGQAVSVGGTSSGWRSAVVEIVETMPITATASATLGAATGSAEASLRIAGVGAATLAAATGASTGVLSAAPSDLTGQASATLAAATVAATGALRIAGQASATLAAATAAGVGVLSISGQGAATLSAATGASEGRISIAAQASATLAAATSSATASLSITGQASAMLAPAFGQATGEILDAPIAATASATLEPATGESTARLALSATAAAILEPATVQSSGHVAMPAQAVPVPGTWPSLAPVGAWPAMPALRGDWPGAATAGVWPSPETSAGHWPGIIATTTWRHA